MKDLHFIVIQISWAFWHRREEHQQPLSAAKPSRPSSLCRLLNLRWCLCFEHIVQCHYNMCLLNMLQILSCKVADPFLTTTPFLQLRQIQNQVAQYAPLIIVDVSWSKSRFRLAKLTPGFRLQAYIGATIIDYGIKYSHGCNRLVIGNKGGL